MTALFAFLVTALLVPGIVGAATAPRWALLAIFTPLFLPAKLKLTAGHLALFLFLAWSALSLTWGADYYGGVLALIKLTIIVGVFCVGAGLADLRSILKGSAIGLSLSSVIAVAQMLDWRRGIHGS